jgi:hypothetical protein
MAWAQEIIDFILKLKPWTTIDEYQTGLYFVLGKVVERRIPEKKLIEILERKKASMRADKIKVDDKYKSLGIEDIKRKEREENIVYKKSKIVPQGWYKKGKKIEHPERYSKNIPYGIYFHLPEVLDISRVVGIPCREVVKDLKFVSTIIKSESIDNLVEKNNSSSVIKQVPLIISAFVRYEIEDGYKVFTNVQDWEHSYHSKALLLLSKQVRDSTISDWSNKKYIEDIELKVKNSLNGADIRDKWGIWTSEVGITDAVPHTFKRNVQEIYAPEEGLKVDIIGGT